MTLPPFTHDRIMAVFDGASLRRLRQTVNAVQDRRDLRPRYRRHQQPGLPTSMLFAVRIWQDGGSTDGDASTQCDRTYTACSLDATTAAALTAYQFGTALTPVKRRPLTGQLDCPATSGDGEIGLGYFNEDGDFQLWDANERLHTTACA